MKKIILLILCFFTIIYLYVLFNRITYNNKISENNQEFIKTKVFSKDSENRGYSDEAKELMNENLKHLNNDPDVKKLYIMMNKSLRVLTLSKNEKEYYNNFIRFAQLQQCLMFMIITKFPNRQKNSFITKPTNEELKMNKIIDFLDYKYTKDYTIKENQIMTNKADVDSKICNRLIHEN